MVIFLPLSVANDAIAAEEVRSQFLMASNVSFVFFLSKSDIIDNAVTASVMSICL